MHPPPDRYAALRAAGLQSLPAAFYAGSHLIEVWAEEADTPFESFAFLMHERIHYLQTVGTTFGIYYSDSLIYRASAINTAAGKVARSEGGLRVSLREWRNRLESDGPVPGDLTTSRLNKAICFADRLDVALGRFLGYDTIYRFADPHLQGVSFSGSHYASIAAPRTAVHPESATYAGRAAIAGAAVIESFALYWQVYAEHFLSGHRPYDHHVLVHTIEQLGSADPAAYLLYGAPVEYAARSLGYSSLWAFPVIADLALSAPMPLMEDAARPEMMAVLRGSGKLVRLGERPAFGWEDIHPGWRFCRIVDELAASGILKRHSPAEGRCEEVYRDIAARICKRFSWAPPDAIAAQFVGAARGQPLPPATISAIHDRRLAAMAARSQQPWLFAFPGYFLAELAGHVTPPVFLCGALPGQAGNAVHIAPDELGAFFYVHLIDHWADLLLPSLVMPSGGPGATVPSGCPFASDNYRCVCNFKSKSLCAAGRIPEHDCVYRREFRDQFGIPPESIQVI